VTSDTIVAYEPPLNPGSGITVLFADNHVEDFDPPTAAKIIAKAATRKVPVTRPSP
jgi:prepilin-type processing-associated H-X9-DG protein